MIIFRLVFLVLILFSQNTYADYQKAIELLNQKLIKESLVEFSNVIKESNDKNIKSKAMYNIAVIHDFGLGVKENDDLAVAWYKESSNHGHKIAQYNLGWMFYHGEKVSKNYFEAFKFYKLSANQGYAKAQFNIANLRLAGLGTIKDNIEAYKWFRLAKINGIRQSEIFIKNLKRILNKDELKKSEKLVEDWIINFTSQEKK